MRGDTETLTSEQQAMLRSRTASLLSEIHQQLVAFADKLGDPGSWATGRMLSLPISGLVGQAVANLRHLGLSADAAWLRSQYRTILVEHVYPV
ncbi:MAG: hypothetical protein QGH74_09910, partial [Candidatus Brocadiia bacterium]|nr:hypothetical protein [Candidatus Brocadiia bacterium]